MSWMNRAQGGAAPPPGPDQLLYNAPQHIGNEQATYPNYQGGTQVNTPPQQYWPMPQQNSQYNQQYDQMYQHQNANQFFQQPIPPASQYNQNYSNPNFNHTQQGYQQNVYPNQTIQQQNYPQKKANTDNWEDNWGWGWEDSSKQPQQSVPQSSQQMPQPQQQVFNNANVIEESFASTDTWNWSMDDKKETNEPPTATPSLQEMVQNPATLSSDSAAPANHSTDVSQASTNDKSDAVKTLSDRDVIKEHLPTLALGKRFHLDNLTPQWSIESQMSQESSDGPHTHSESTYRSENQSRNSSKSSPGLNSETLNFNYSQSGHDELFTQNSEWSRHSTEEASLGDKMNRSGSRQDSHNDLTTSLQEMSIANCENPMPDSSQANKEKDKIEKKHQSENISPASQPTPSVSPANFPPPPPSMTVPSNVTSAATSTSGQHYPPPTNFSSSQNPFKHAGPFSHKTISKAPQANPFTNQSHPSQSNGTNLTSPSVVNKVSQHNRVPVAFGANLETTPDNSERPDQPQVSTYRPMSISQQVPENMEVAPKNDRNEYLQTAHLSSSDYGVNTDFSRKISLPGLRRMVVGQQESEYNQSLTSGDEPPPGLARMVPGQQTESDSVYNQPADNYMDRHVDGQTTDISGRPYRQADGQQTPHNYTQSASNRGSERRPVGLDRMVPGEPSNDEYSQYQANYNAPNEHRVVTGVDHDYPIPTDAGPTDRREQNVDGSDYSEQAPSNPSRNIIGAQETNEVSLFNATVEEEQREVTMEGENLQDLSLISSTELSYSRDQILDGANVNITDAANDRKTDRSDSAEHPTSSSRRQSINRVNTSGEDSERDKVFKSSPRRDRDKRKSSKDRDRDRDKGRDARYSRGERKYDRDNDRKTGRDDRRSEKDRDRGERDRNRRDDSPNSRRHRRSTRSHRYETEDTDYYSDREKERRRYREGSYSSSKPPRPDDKDRRHRDERNRRYNTIERDRRYDDEREGASRSRKSEHRERDRYERRYRDIDPNRKYGNLRREEEERRRAAQGETYSSPSRADSREAVATDEESESRRRSDRHRRHRADAYLPAAPDPYALQRQQYQYYEHLRLTNPVAYMEVYKQLMGGHVAAVAHSPRSGRSSANDTAARLDTEVNTDASLNLQLEESTARSERMTPLKFCTAHAKGVISSRHVVVVRPSYPVDGLPATVQVLDLAAAMVRDASAQELAAFPGPLVRGLTHKKSVAEYCAWRARSASPDAPDAGGRALLWRLLGLLLRQNGALAGADVAELLVNDASEHPHRLQEATSRRGSSTEEGTIVAEPAPPHDTAAAVDTLRAHLLIGNRQEALEWAMASRLWGHALQLAAHGSRRERAAVAARFVASLPPADPLHTLYAALAQRQPPAAVHAADARWADWRPHAAMLLANSSAKPEQDARTLVQLGDSLAARGFAYSAQFCYVAAGVPFARHPLTPLASGPAPDTAPRLSLLLADPSAASLAQHASNEAVFATEVYEYALSLRQDAPYALAELQPYKFLMACRLVDAGRYGRALAYVEQVARAVTQAPQHYSPRLLAQVSELGERLKYHDPALQEVEESVEAEEGEASEGSPRHAQRWLDDLRAAQLQVEHSPQSFHPEEALHAWPEQQHIQQNVEQPPLQTYSEQQMEDSPDYSHFYQQPAPPAPYAPVAPIMPVSEPPVPVAPEPVAPAPLYDPYWGHTDTSYSYGERLEPEESSERPPAITMPGASRSAPYDHYDRYDDATASMPDRSQRETESPAPAADKSKQKREEGKGGGGGGKGGGWFGGLFTKLSLRPPNQMILPDDKDPAIVWDAATQRWRDRDGNAEGDSGPPPPPPTMADLAPQHRSGVAPPPGQLPPPSSGPNMFKMQKTRNIKKAYVDVLNPGAGSNPAAAPALPAPAPAPTAPLNYFVPAPMAESQGAAESRHSAI